ncbi:MAG: outer membrane beta-barrel protein [Pseudomonadota bacterium]
MKTLTTALSLITLVNGAALAGSLDDAAPAPNEPVARASTAAPGIGGDWTGPYAGVQFGYIDVDGTGGADGDDALFGVHAGYQYDFGTFVLGGEVDYDGTDVNLAGAATVDSVARLKLRAGYDFGLVLGYLTAGVAEVDTTLGDEGGNFYGIGFAYQISDQYLIGAEVLEHSFDNIGGSGVNADATTFTLRGSFRF